MREYLFYVHENSFELTLFTKISAGCCLRFSVIFRETPLSALWRGAAGVFLGGAPFRGTPFFMRAAFTFPA